MLDRRHADVHERDRDAASREQHRPRALLSRSVAARAQARGARDAAVELRRRRPRRAVPAAQPLRLSALRLSLPVSRRAHAARAHPRRLHRQRQRRPDGAGLPPGGARRAARDRLAARAGLRVDRHPRHQPRLVPRDADDRARAADQGARRSITSRRTSPTSCGTGCRRSTCARRSRATSRSTSCGACGCRSVPLPFLERVRGREVLLVYARYDLTFPVDLSRMLVERVPATPASTHQLLVLPCGHYSTGVSPFKWMDGLTLCRFLSRSAVTVREPPLQVLDDARRAS